MTQANELKIMKLLLALSLLIFSGCGTQTYSQVGGTAITPTLPTGNSIPANVQPIVDKFVRVAAFENYQPIVVQNLTVTFVSGNITICGTAEPDFVGCTTWDTVNQNITLSQDYWDSADAGSKEALVFHEMGHAFLNRVHRADVNNGLPLSIMHAQVLTDPTYTVNLEQYYYELFNQSDLESVLPLQMTGTPPQDVLDI